MEEDVVNKCPCCFGHGWLTNSDGDTWTCEGCLGTGLLSEMWSGVTEPPLV